MTAKLQFEQDLLREVPFLRRRARTLERQRSPAEDLLHDTLERALLNQARFRPDTNLRRWLLTTMRNLFIDRYRLRRYRRQRSEAVARHIAQSQATEVSPPELPETIILELPDLVGKLPSPIRETAQLVLVERRSYRQAAEHLGIKTATVASRVARGRHRLRSLLVEAQPEPAAA